MVHIDNADTLTAEKLRFHFTVASDISPTLLRKSAKAIGMSVEELITKE